MNDRPLNVKAMTDFFQTYCEDQGINIIIDPAREKPETDIKGNVYMPAIDPFNLEETISGGFHEAGHHHKDVKWALEMYQDIDKEGVSDAEKNVVNILLDHLCERNDLGSYRGRDRSLARRRENTFNEHPDLIPALAHHDMPIEAALLAHDLESRHEWQTKGLDAPEVLPASIKDHYKAIKEWGYHDKMKHILDTKDVDALRQLVRSLLELEDIEPQAGEGEGDGEGGGEGEGQGEGKGQCQECGGTGKDGEGGECKACDGTGEGEEGEGEGGWESNNRHDSWDEGEPGQAGGGVGSDGSDYGDPQRSLQAWHDGNPSQEDVEQAGRWGNDTDTFKERGRYTPSTSKVRWERQEEKVQQMIATGKPITSGRTGRWNSDQDSEGWERAAILKAIGGSTISKKIQRYLKVMATDTYEYGRRRGKLHSKSIHRLYQNQGKPGPVAPAIFKQKNASRLINDSAVMILQDCSGSMTRSTTHGSLYTTASACSIAISETLRDLRITHEMYGFTDAGSGITMTEYKRAGEKTCSVEKLIDRYVAPRVMHCNADAESILLVAERLMALPEKNKLLIVLSDGEPAASSGHGDSGSYLKKVCAMLEEDTPIHLVGIGIDSSSVSRYYKNHRIVRDVSALDEVLVPLIRDALLGG